MSTARIDKELTFPLHLEVRGTRWLLKEINILKRTDFRVVPNYWNSYAYIEKQLKKLFLNSAQKWTGILIRIDFLARFSFLSIYRCRNTERTISFSLSLCFGKLASNTDGTQMHTECTTILKYDEREPYFWTLNLFCFKFCVKIWC